MQLAALVLPFMQWVHSSGLDVGGSTVCIRHKTDDGSVHLSDLCRSP